MNINHITFSPEVSTLCLYFHGCNFECKACIRKKTLKDVHLHKISSEIRNNNINLEEVINKIRTLEPKKIIFLGGEPSIDPELPSLLAESKALDCYNIILTNGFRLPELKNIDEMQISIKAITYSLHTDFTGKSNKTVLKNFVKVYNSGIRLRAESIFIPDYIDYVEISKIAEFIAGVDKNIPYRIDGYVKVADLYRKPSPEEVEKAADIARTYLRNVSCLRGDEKLRSEVVEVL